MKDVYQILIENLTGKRLDEAVFQDEGFISANKTLDEALAEYDKLSLPNADDKVVRHVFDSYIAQSARYAEVAYGQGIKDAVQLLKDMGIIGI